MAALAEVRGAADLHELRVCRLVRVVTAIAVLVSQPWVAHVLRPAGVEDVGPRHVGAAVGGVLYVAQHARSAGDQHEETSAGDDRRRAPHRLVASSQSQSLRRNLESTPSQAGMASGVSASASPSSATGRCQGGMRLTIGEKTWKGSMRRTRA